LKSLEHSNYYVFELQLKEHLAVETNMALVLVQSHPDTSPASENIFNLVTEEVNVVFDVVEAPAILESVHDIFDFLVCEPIFLNYVQLSVSRDLVDLLS
jgi:hypothetical protein